MINSNLSYRVKDADIALCVLSLPDALSTLPRSEMEISIPAELTGLITAQTLFLLNKADLLPDISVENVTVRVRGMADVFPAWIASISTGAGMADFLADLGTAVNSRYVSFCRTSCLGRRYPPLYLHFWLTLFL